MVYTPQFHLLNLLNRGLKQIPRIILLRGRRTALHKKIQTFTRRIDIDIIIIYIFLIFLLLLQLLFYSILVLFFASYLYLRYATCPRVDAQDFTDTGDLCGWYNRSTVSRWSLTFLGWGGCRCHPQLWWLGRCLCRTLRWTECGPV